MREVIMTICSDEWIIKMAKEKGMIDPYEETQVRRAKNKDVISYGVSSYGYDIRVSQQFRIPRNVMTICVGKSTYARCGIIVNVTPFEPGWEGRAVLEISNTTPLPAKIYAEEGLAQVLFFESDKPCRQSYADRAGKYQFQQEITLPKL